MIRAEMIPDEVVEAFVDAYYAKDMTRKTAIAAALNAWPDAELVECMWKDGPDFLILPLTQENSNADG